VLFQGKVATDDSYMGSCLDVWRLAETLIRAGGRLRA
jgi:hypothetical protein